MSNSTSQVFVEATTPSSESQYLENEIFFNSQLKSLSQPCSARWLSLSPYKRAKSFFDDWDKDTKDIAFVQTLESEKTGYDCLSDSQISTLSLDSTGSEHSVDELEIARCRLLGILRCYIFNLEKGTLVTEENIEREILKGLRMVLELSAGGGEDHGASSKSSEGFEDELDIEMVGSVGEEVMILEMIDGYMKQVKRCGCEVDRNIGEFARRILDESEGRGSLREGTDLEF